MLTHNQIIERKKGIGGSDAAAICGVSRYKTPVQVYLDKITPVIEGDPSCQKIANVLARGHELEDLIRERFSQMIGYKVLIPEKTIYHKNIPYLFANIDGYIKETKAIVEIKTARSSFKSEWGESFTDQVPKEYLTQVHHYMNVCDLAKSYIVVCFATEETFSLLRILLKHMKLDDVSKMEIPLDIRIYEVQRSPSFDKVLMEVEKKFWEENVERRIAPNWTSIDDLKELYPIGLEDKKVIASEDDIIILEKLIELKNFIENHKKLIEEQQSKLIEKLKDASQMEDAAGNVLITYKSSITNRFDTTAFKKEYSSLYNEFLTPSSSRRFLIKGEKNDQA